MRARDQRDAKSFKEQYKKNNSFKKKKTEKNLCCYTWLSTLKKKPFFKIPFKPWSLFSEKHNDFEQKAVTKSYVHKD